MIKYLLFFVLLITSELSHARWIYNADRDPFTDEKASTAIKSNPGYLSPSLIIRCKDGYLESYYHPGQYLGSDDYSYVRYRFDKLEPEEAGWPLSTSGKAVFSDTAVEFARYVLSKSSLVIEAEDFSGEMQRSKFSLSGSSGPVGKVLSDCKLMSKNPRSIDDEIWRRVVQDLDKQSIEGTELISDILNEFASDEDKAITDRSNIEIYRSLSSFYNNIIFACTEGKDFAMKLSSCIDYRKLISNDVNADYPLEAVDLLIELLDA